MRKILFKFMLLRKNVTGGRETMMGHHQENQKEHPFNI